MDDDLDMSMRAPYISMSESSELPMLIAEDLMWGAQPDLKQTLNINKKMDHNQQVDNIEKSNVNFQRQRSTVESSLASLLLQHQNKQLQDQQTEQPVILSNHHDLKVQIFDQGDNITLVNPNTLMVQTQDTTGLLRGKFRWK